MKWSDKVGNYSVFGDIERIYEAFTGKKLNDLSNKEINKITKLVEEYLVDNFLSEENFYSEFFNAILEDIENEKLTDWFNEVFK